MASSQQTCKDSAVKSGSAQQLELVFVLKQQLDMVYKQLNYFRGACKSVNRLKRLVKGMLDSDQNCINHSMENTDDHSLKLQIEFVKFERNYRFWRKRLRKLDKQLLNENLYDKLHGLYENMEKSGPIAVENSKANVSYNDVGEGIVITEDDIEVKLDMSELVANSLPESGGGAPTPELPIIEDATIPPVPKKPKKTCKYAKVKCDIDGCKYATKYSSRMKSHMATHSTERPFKCGKCPKTFKTNADLKLHQNSHEKKRFECTFEGCTVNYAYKKDIKKHIQIFHTKEAPLLHCSWNGCGYSTYRNESLKIHAGVHTGDRPFKCPHCQLTFKSPGNLSHHKKIHDNQHRYKCSFEGCPYSTNRTEYLKSHSAVHTGERQFKCIWPGCGQAFKTASNLWSHKKIHENQRGHKCSWPGCHYAANLHRSLKIHEETVHRKKKFANKKV